MGAMDLMLIIASSLAGVTMIVTSWATYRGPAKKPEGRN
jgi:hypothetical protein